MTPSAKIILSAAVAMLPTAALADWNGYYAGASYGDASGVNYEVVAGISPDVDLPDGEAVGGFFGSRRQNNGFVLGGELAIETTPDATTALDDVNVEYLIDLKLTAGVPLGQALAYGILSLSGASGSYGPNDIDASGFGIGVGGAVKLGDNFSIGAEYLARSMTQEFVETDIDVGAETLTLRAAFHF